MRGFIGLAAGLVLVACSAPGDARTFSAGDVTVVDSSGLVKEVVQEQAPAVESVSGPTATKGESLTQVLVTWPASSCVETWTLRLSGNALDLSIEPGASPSGCEGTQVAHAVRLDLNRVVDAENIELSLTDGL